MMKKQGITVTMMVITVIILIILAGTISISVYSTLNYSRLSSWANELMYIQDVVDEELNKSSILVDASDTVSVNIGVLTDEQKVEQFEGETITDNSVELSILDLGKLDVTNTLYGNLETEEDVYAVSLTTGRVYYAQGFEIDDTVYFTLTDGLKQRFELASTVSLNTIVFMPSKVGYTNEPIKVTVKVPQTFSSISISTTNEEIQISSQAVVNNLYEYTVNTENVAGNYTVSVSYSDGAQMHTISYEVNSYDITAPVINKIGANNFVYKQTEKSTIEYITDINATDESGIKYIKYAVGKIENDKAKEYFSQDGNLVVNGNINLDKNVTVYTIYAEDNAGNVTTTIIDIGSLKGWVKQGFTVVKGDQVLEIGDIVNYDETAGGTKTGLTATDWKVLGADENGNLLLVSTEDIKESHRFGYEDSMTTSEAKMTECQKDWLNGADELDTICEPYGYGEGVVGNARSVTEEDVNSVTGYDKTTYEVGTLYQYGNEVNFLYNGTVNPKFESATKNGNLTTEHNDGFYFYNGENFVTVNDLTTGENGKIFATLTSNFISYSEENITTISSTDNAKSYSMLFGNNDRNYWLASRSQGIFTNCIKFALGAVRSGKVNAYGLWYSDGTTYRTVMGVRAVVTLSRYITFTGSSETGWSY